MFLVVLEIVFHVMYRYFVQIHVFENTRIIRDQNLILELWAFEMRI